ncbi:MAG: substrate-binding domain-containing protein [Oscillospiraceae bacterium]|nr:substrate-binding domain-containing protein [Oscillospiraceae bacterium]
MKRHLNRVLAGLCAVSLLALTGCSRSSSQEMYAAVPEGTVIHVITKSQDPYWDTVKNAAMEAGEEEGITVIYEAPETEDMLDVQIQMVEEAIDSGTKGIVIAALDMDALNESLARATEAGIPVITIDSDVSYEGRLSCISTQNYAAGAIAARYAAQLIGETGDVAIISHNATAQTAVERVSGFTDELAGTQKGIRVSMKDQPSDAAASEAPAEGTAPEVVPDGAPQDGEFPRGVPDDAKQKMSDSENIAASLGYPNIHVIDTKVANADVQLSREATIQLIRENPDIKLIYATNQPGTVGACQAIEELGVSGKVQLVGFDYFEGADEYLINGVLDGVIAQNPYNMGYFGVRYVYKTLTNQEIQPTVDTGATLITIDNMNDPDIQFLIDPNQAVTTGVTTND